MAYNPANRSTIPLKGCDVMTGIQDLVEALPGCEVHFGDRNVVVKVLSAEIVGENLVIRPETSFRLCRVEGNPPRHHLETLCGGFHPTERVRLADVKILHEGDIAAIAEQEVVLLAEVGRHKIYTTMGYMVKGVAHRGHPANTLSKDCPYCRS